MANPGTGTKSTRLRCDNQGPVLSRTTLLPTPGTNSGTNDPSPWLHHAYQNLFEDYRTNFSGISRGIPGGVFASNSSASERHFREHIYSTIRFPFSQVHNGYHSLCHLIFSVASFCFWSDFRHFQIYHSRKLGFPFNRMWQDRAGYLRAFSGYQTIKKVPKERGTRSNAGLGAQDILFSSLSFDLCPIFVCLAVSCPVTSVLS